MINSNLSKFITEVDNLRNLVRYQTAPRVSSETVAEHSYYVTAYVLKLADYYDFDILKALKMAVLHDFAEAYISDVPHPVKDKFPEISNILEKAEYDINKEYISEKFAEDMMEFNECSSPEGCIVSLADILSVISYSVYEIGLGNSKYMRQTLDRGIRRFNRLFDDCKKYLKEGVNPDDIEKEVIDFYKYYVV